MSGYNTAHLCPVCGGNHLSHTGCPLNPTPDPDTGSCCDQIADLAVQLENLINTLGGGGSDQGPITLNVYTVITRPTCDASGKPVIAYDIVPSNMTNISEIQTFYRPLPPEESDCVCD